MNNKKGFPRLTLREEFGTTPLSDGTLPSRYYVKIEFAVLEEVSIECAVEKNLLVLDITEWPETKDSLEANSQEFLLRNQYQLLFQALQANPDFFGIQIKSGHKSSTVCAPKVQTVKTQESIKWRDLPNPRDLAETLCSLESYGSLKTLVLGLPDGRDVTITL